MRSWFSRRSRASAEGTVGGDRDDAGTAAGDEVAPRQAERVGHAASSGAGEQIGSTEDAPDVAHAPDVTRRLLIASLATGAGAGAVAALTAVGGAEVIRDLATPPVKVKDEPSPLRKAEFDASSLEEHLGLFLPELHALPDDRDDQAIRRAAEAATKAGGGTVLLSRPVYRFGAPVALNGLRDVTFESRSRSVIRAAGPIVRLNAFEGSKDAVDADGDALSGAGASRITIRGITFDGGLANGDELDAQPFYDFDEKGERIEAGFGAFARDAREYVPAGATDEQAREAVFCAVYVAGDRDPNSETELQFSDIAVEQVQLNGISSLPIYLRGVRGLAAVDDSHAYRCLDIGFTYCENVRFSRNRVDYSADNGVSISRGNRNVSCTANIISKAWYYGIHLGGFSSEGGSQHVACTGNTVVHSAHVGINLYDAPADVTITGNMVSDVHRGSGDDGVAMQGYAVFIRGLRTPEVLSARNIVITGNSFARAHRAGICISHHVEDVLISGNVFYRIGLPRMPDGSDVSVSNGSWNYVVGKPGSDAANASTVKRIVVSGNAMFEDRPVMLDRERRRAVAVWSGGSDFVVGQNYGPLAEMGSSHGVTLPRVRPGDSAPGAPGAVAYDEEEGRLLISDGRHWRDAAGRRV